MTVFDKINSMADLRKDTKITLGLAITVIMLTAGAISQFFWAMNTLASEEFVEQRIQDKIEAVIVRISGVEYTLEKMHDDIKYVRDRVDRK